VVTELTHDLGAPVDVILRDGSTLRLRAPTAADEDALLAFFSGLSPRSLYLRFHGAPTIRPALVEPFLDPDWIERGALIGTSEGRVVALASCARLRDPSTAEAAFAVADEFQGRGIGTRLLEQLAARAATGGIEQFVAEVMPDNRAMLGVFEAAGFETTRELEGGTIELVLRIEPTETFLEHVSERDHVAVRTSLEPFFKPRSAAVIGASRRPGSIGGELFRNLLRAEFTGAAYPVNRGGESVAGVRGYGSISEIDDDIDLAVICLPGERVLPATEEALQKGVRALCVISAGFAEMGTAGRERQDRLLELVRSYGARMLGPNCLGIASADCNLNATFGPRALPPGNVAFSSQSGALGLAVLEHAAERGLGLSAFVSIGNKADVSSNDLVEYWEDDAASDVIVLYLESFGNPRKFGRLARRVSRKKAILAMKSGTTSAGARAASSHTAALAGSDAAVDALFRQAGVVRTKTLEELIDASVLLSSQPLPAGRRVAVLTNAGGLGILCADACDAEGLELPPLGEATAAKLSELLPAEASLANPVDMLGSATAEIYEAALPVVLADPGIDSVIVLFVPPVIAGAEEVAEAIARVTNDDKPVLAAVMSEGGIPAALRGPDRRLAAFAYPESAARALGLAVRRAEWLRRPAGSTVELDADRAKAEELVRTALLDKDDLWLDAGEARRLLGCYGIALVEERLAATAAEAAAAASAFGFPVVVKSAAAGAHKTETGGVALNLGDEAQVLDAAERIGPPVLVQPMVRGGVELLAGIVQDPVFGPLVAFGPGGVFAELIGQAEFRISPLTDVDARELVTSGKAGELVKGFRGAPAVDVDALVDLVLRLARIAEYLPEVSELDLNPVMAFPEGYVAVDARVRLRRPEGAASIKGW
jgi:acetyl coenzyme A synthetase (ADP forming)-like protein